MSQSKNEANDIPSQPFILVQICKFLFMLSFIEQLEQQVTTEQYLRGMTH